MYYIRCLKRGVRLSSINFIDEDGNFVGIDDFQQCCEKFKWSIEPYGVRNLDTYKNKVKRFDELGELVLIDELEGYKFRSTKPVDDSIFTEDYGLVFELFKKGEETQYLCIRNSHNGYYSHRVISGCYDKDDVIEDVYEDSNKFSI